MRILIDARMYGLEYTGIGRYLINLVSELVKIDHQDEFAIILKKKYYDLLKFPDNWTKILSNIPHYSLPEQLFLPYVISKFRPDIVHFPHFNVPIMYRGRYVVTIHDLTMQRQGKDATKLPYILYFLKRIPYLLVTKNAVKNAVKIITPCKVTATDVSNYYNKSIQNITVTYEGYNKSYLSVSNLSDEMSILSKYSLMNKKYFFYVGNCYPHKNMKLTIDAILDVVLKKKLDVVFVIAGLKDYFVRKLETYIKDNKAEKYIKLIGYVKDAELNVLYKNSLAFVYPSLSEGFGLQGLEATAMGTILVLSNIPVFKEIYEYHAVYFDPKNKDSISGALYTICSMKTEEKNRFIRNAQNFIKRYSWRKMAEETLAVYRGAIQ